MDRKLNKLYENIQNGVNYRQNLIDDAIKDIQKAIEYSKTGELYGGLESKLERWKNELKIRGLNEEEIEEVMIKALHAPNLESKTFSKFDLEDYTEIIYEGKSGHGDMKAVTNLLKDAYKKGLIDYQDTKNGWIVKSKKDSSQEVIHKGERAFHYLRRFIQKIS